MKRGLFVIVVIAIVMFGTTSLAQNPAPGATAGADSSSAAIASPTINYNGAARQFPPVMQGPGTALFPGQPPNDESWYYVGGGNCMKIKVARVAALAIPIKGIEVYSHYNETLSPNTDGYIYVNCVKWDMSQSLGSTILRAKKKEMWGDIHYAATALMLAEQGSNAHNFIAFIGARIMSVAELRLFGFALSSAGAPSGNTGIGGAGGAGLGHENNYLRRLPRAYVIALDVLPPPEGYTNAPQPPPPPPPPPPPSTSESTVPSEIIVHHVLEGEATLNVKVSGQVQLLAPPLPTPTPRQKTAPRRRAQVHKPRCTPTISVHLEHSLFGTHVKVTGGNLTSLDENWGKVTFDVTGAPSCP